MAAKLPIMADNVTSSIEKETSVRLLMAMVETAYVAAVERATMTFSSAMKVATHGGSSHQAAVVGASIGEITGDASR